MRRRVFAATTLLSTVLLASMGCSPQEPVDTGSTEQSILGGNPVFSGQFPTVVAVVVGGGGLCTGTLVAPDIVITAAHCVSPTVSGLGSQEAVTANTQVVFDGTDIFKGGGTVVGARETIAHPAFTRPGQPDIGIIRLDQKMDREFTPINLDPSAAPVGISVTIVGYGINDSGQSGTGFFLEGNTSVGCAQYGVDDKLFLCFNQEAGNGKCNGDSGGPSFGAVGGTNALVGITSFGDQNCEFFGADFRVDAARPFLEENAPELFCAADNLCDETCGKNGKAADPDCAPACIVDADCGDDSVCNAAEGGICEPAPFTPGGIGAECGEGMAECASGLCATGSDGSFCTANCTSNDECPDGFECTQVEGGGGACWAVEDSGCQTSAGSARLSGMLLLLAMFGLIRRRRRS